MANRTVKDATSVHGTNPQYLVEKVIRTRIYDSRYWKEECFALTAELLVDKAMELREVGGVYGGNVKPSPFLCLTLKMLQIQPEKDIIIEFIKQDEFKYVRALGAFYLRLVYSSLDCYKYLEPLLNDYRKLRIVNREGQYFLMYMDEFIDTLLHEDRVCDVILPRVQKRWVHETSNQLETRVSLLEDDLEDLESESEDEEIPSPPPSPHSMRNRDQADTGRNRDDRHNRHSPGRDRHQGREREKRHRSHSRERDRHVEKLEHERKKRRSRSRERRHKSPGRHHHHRERTREQRERERPAYDWPVREIREREHRHAKELEEREYYNREKGRERERERGREKEKDRRVKHRRDRGRDYDEDPDIAEANALRAQLGLPPLRP